MEARLRFGREFNICMHFEGSLERPWVPYRAYHLQSINHVGNDS
jgi:hypothetical protein